MRIALALVASLVSATAGAQWDQAISDKELLDPWIQAAAVLRVLSVDDATAAATGRRFVPLEEDLASLRAELENIAIGIVGRPEFAYDAAQRSFELSQQVEKVGQGLDAVFTELSVAERPDVKAAKAAIAGFQQILAGRTRFERDVLTTVGSGSKNAMQALAARWWTAADRVDDVRSALVGLQRRAER